MNSFTLLTEESSETLSREQLVSMYNDAVEMIWFLESRREWSQGTARWMRQHPGSP